MMRAYAYSKKNVSEELACEALAYRLEQALSSELLQGVGLEVLVGSRPAGVHRLQRRAHDRPTTRLRYHLRSEGHDVPRRPGRWRVALTASSYACLVGVPVAPCSRTSLAENWAALVLPLEPLPEPGQLLALRDVQEELDERRTLAASIRSKALMSRSGSARVPRRASPFTRTTSTSS